jgi:hypothetical protein
MQSFGMVLADPEFVSILRCGVLRAQRCVPIPTQPVKWKGETSALSGGLANQVRQTAFRIFAQNAVPG